MHNDIQIVRAFFLRDKANCPYRNNEVSVKRDRESNPVNTDTEGTIESVHINGVFVLNGFLSQGTKKTFRNGPLVR